MGRYFWNKIVEWENTTAPPIISHAVAYTVCNYCTGIQFINSAMSTMI